MNQRSWKQKGYAFSPLMCSLSKMTAVKFGSIESLSLQSIENFGRVIHFHFTQPKILGEVIHFQFTWLKVLGVRFTFTSLDWKIPSLAHHCWYCMWWHCCFDIWMRTYLKFHSKIMLFWKFPDNRTAPKKDLFSHLVRKTRLPLYFGTSRYSSFQIKTKNRHV